MSGPGRTGRHKGRPERCPLLGPTRSPVRVPASKGSSEPPRADPTRASGRPAGGSHGRHVRSLARPGGGCSSRALSRRAQRGGAATSALLPAWHRRGLGPSMAEPSAGPCFTPARSQPCLRRGLDARRRRAALDLQTNIIESVFEPAPPDSMGIQSPPNQRPKQL